MTEYHDRSWKAARPFSTAAYSAAGSAELLPTVLPTKCQSKAAGTCEITFHHSRGRKTGPCFPIAVLQCETHGHAFTLYPLGHVPYGRVAVAPVSPDGEPLRAESPPLTLDWQPTVFGAALDAAAGRAWPREGATREGLWEAQLDRLSFGAKLFGLAPTANGRIREQLVDRLSVPLVVLSDASRRYQAADGYEARGQILTGLIQGLQPARCVLDQVLAGGALVGLFGEVRRWDRGEAVPRCTLFRPGGTPSG